jgi:hypothetical protein
LDLEGKRPIKKKAIKLHKTQDTTVYAPCSFSFYFYTHLPRPSHLKYKPVSFLGFLGLGGLGSGVVVVLGLLAHLSCLVIDCLVMRFLSYDCLVLGLLSWDLLSFVILGLFLSYLVLSDNVSVVIFLSSREKIHHFPIFKRGNITRQNKTGGKTHVPQGHAPKTHAPRHTSTLYLSLFVGKGRRGGLRRSLKIDTRTKTEIKIYQEPNPKHQR